MGTPTLVSPWTWSVTDSAGRALTISVDFSVSTRSISGGQVVRDAGCEYGHIYVGVGGDGAPETTTGVFAVPFGSTNLNKPNFTSRGFSTIEDLINSVQITAGP